MQDLKINSFLRRLFENQIFIFLFLLTLSFLTYRYGLASLPRGDQVEFMRERGLTNSDWTFFWHSISYHRQSYILERDYFLFRPLFHAFLGVIDIFFRDRLNVISAIGVLLHAVVCWVLYLFTLRVTESRLFSIFTSVFFAIQYAGIEMIYWTHINGYMFAIIFFTLGLLRLLDPSDFLSQKSVRFAIVFFVISVLFHELLIYALLGTGILFALLCGKGREMNDGSNSHSLKKLLAIFLIPPLIYWLLDFVDIIRCNPVALFFDPYDRVGGLTLYTVITNFFFIAGVFLCAFLNPMMVKLNYPSYAFQGQWDISKLPFPTMIGFGIFIFMLLGLWIAWLLVDCRRNLLSKRKTYDAAILLVALYFLILVVALGAARVSMRGFDYIKTATYYYYIMNYLLLLLVILCFGFIRERFERGKSLKIFLLIPVFIFGWQPPYNFIQIQKTLKPRSWLENTVAKNIREISDLTGKSSPYCYGGSFELVIWSALVPDFLIYRHNCIGTSKRAVYAMTGPDNTNLWLLKLDKNYEQLDTPIPLHKDDFVLKTASIFDPKLSDERIAKRMEELVGGIPIYLSSRSFRPAYYTAEIDPGIITGLIVGYQDPKNYLYVAFERNFYYLIAVKNGEVREFSHSRSLDWNHERVHLSVVRMHGLWLILFDQNAVIAFRADDALEGRVGFSYLGRQNEPPSFSNTFVVEEKEGATKPFFYTPVAKLLPLGKVKVK